MNRTYTYRRLKKIYILSNIKILIKQILHNHQSDYVVL